MRGKTIALLGLAFKPNTDDMRDAPSIAIVTALEDAGAKVRAYDPASMEQARAADAERDILRRPLRCAEGAEALVIVTEWDPFRALDLQRLAGLMAAPTIVDLRNVYRAGGRAATRISICRRRNRLTRVSRGLRTAQPAGCPVGLRRSRCAAGEARFLRGLRIAESARYRFARSSRESPVRCEQRLRRTCP